MSSDEARAMLRGSCSRSQASKALGWAGQTHWAVFGSARAATPSDFHSSMIWAARLSIELMALRTGLPSASIR